MLNFSKQWLPCGKIRFEFSLQHATLFTPPLHLVCSLFVCVHKVDQIHLAMWRKTREGIELCKTAASAVDKKSQDWSFSVNALPKHLTLAERMKAVCVCVHKTSGDGSERKMKHWSREWRQQHEKGSVYDNALNPHKGKRVEAMALPALWLMLSEGLSTRSLALIHWALVALWNVNGEASWFL